MYTWQVVGHDPAEGPLCTGIGGELAPIMRLIEDYLARDAGFVGYIAEAVQRLSVGQLEPVHVPTGREWVGRRDRSGGCLWRAATPGCER
jgi:hypothetical protein